MGFLAVICGLKSEAGVVTNCPGADKVRIAVSGASAQRAYELARIAAQDGAAAIVSLGVSGGLDPALAPGDILIGDEIIADEAGDCFSADSFLVSAAKKALSDRAVSCGRLFGSDAIVQSAAHKAALFQNHNAIAVDMESHGAARAAAEFRTPFIAIRAVADPAARALPKAAMNAVAPDGSTRIAATLVEMAKAPGDIPALLQLGSDSQKALKALRRDLGPLFGGLFLALDL